MTKNRTASDPLWEQLSILPGDKCKDCRFYRQYPVRIRYGRCMSFRIQVMGVMPALDDDCFRPVVDPPGEKVSLL